MAMEMCVASLMLVLLVVAPTVYGVDHTVGGSSGWTQTGDYATWAAGETFTVGDNLVFKYDSSHGVDTVSESDYNSCSSSNAIKSYNDGNSKVPLSSAGKMYFICPTPGHCSSGMKLAINVVAASTTPSGGSSPPATPSPPSSGSTPATTAASPPPPPKNGAVSGFGHSSKQLMMGTLLVSSIILGFMC